MNALIATLVGLSLVAAPQSETPKIAGPFRTVTLAPADVTMYMHVDHAAELRKELARRPIALWLSSLVESGTIRTAWSAVARQCGVDELRLFDAIIGRECTLMIRNDAEWALVTRVDEGVLRPILIRLNAKAREPRHDMAVAELPEHQLLVARNRSQAVIGPSNNSGLFYHTLARVENTGAATAKNELLARAIDELGPGRIGVWLQHEPPMGGASAVVADVQGDRLTIRHIAKFEHAPFNRGVTKLTCDFSPVLKFKDRSLITVMQPMDVDDGPVEAYLTASLGEGLMSRDMRANAGDRRLLVFNEMDERLQPQPSDLLTTTMTACVQVKDGSHAMQQLDDQMMRITGRLSALNQGALLVQTPQIQSTDGREPRQVRMTCGNDVSGWFAGGFPVMKNVSLNWTVADGPSGTWYVIGSHPAALNEVVETLNRPDKPSASMTGRFDSCGVSNGIRLGRHLRSWSDQAALLAEPDGVEEFRATLRLMSYLAGGVKDCQWQLARPSQNEMRLDIQVRLAPPESAEEE